MPNKHEWGLRATKRLEAQKQLKSELLKAKLRGEIKHGDYQLANDEYTNEISMIEEQLELLGSGEAKLDSFVSFAELMLVDAFMHGRRPAPNSLSVFKLYCSKTVCSMTNISVF